MNPTALLARAIAVALNTFADAVEGTASPLVNAVAQTAAAPGTTVNAANDAGVATTTLNEATNSGGLTVVAALEQGLKLTGAELDFNGLVHNPAINTATPSVTKKNIWKKKVGLSADEYAAAIEAAKAAIPAQTAAAQTPTPMPGQAGGAAPMPGQVATGGAPMPGQTSTAAPMPGQTAVVDDPHADARKQILDEVNKITSDLEVDYDVVLELMGEFGGTDGTFATVPVEQYPMLHKALVGWSTCLQLIANVTVECLQLNGNDQAVIVEHIYNAGQFGCTDATLVSKHDTWRLYEKLAEYRGALQTHFKQAVTPLAANPYL